MVMSRDGNHVLICSCTKSISYMIESSSYRMIIAFTHQNKEINPSIYKWVMIVEQIVICDITSVQPFICGHGSLALKCQSLQAVSEWRKQVNLKVVNSFHSSQNDLIIKLTLLHGCLGRPLHFIECSIWTLMLGSIDLSTL